jgi:hypothetical protein
MLPDALSAAFLSVGPSLVAVGIRLELPTPQLWLFVRHGFGRRRGGYWKREKERDEVGKCTLLTKARAWRNGLPRP